MTKKDSRLSPQELQLIEPLRRGPELMERFETILQISANAEGPVKSADEVEGLLIREMRLLGNATMGSWAAGAEKHLGEQWRQKDVSARARKKKRSSGGVFSGGSACGSKSGAREARNICACCPKASV